MLPVIVESEAISSVRVKSSEREEIDFEVAVKGKRENKKTTVKKSRLFCDFLWNKDWNNL